MTSALLFVFGAAFGSFIDVLANRYQPDKFLLNRSVMIGRSYCPYCRRSLRWFELVPIVSYLVLWGRCRTCHKRISLECPLTEIISGLIFVFVPLFLRQLYLPSSTFYFLSATWILIFSVLLLISLIDRRINIIPDEATVLLVMSGIPLIFLTVSQFGLVNGSFLGSYALLFGFRSSIWINHLFAAFISVVFFGSLILITRGRGMGIGDLKIGLALGFVFGWPDIILVLILAFIIGSLVGAASIVFRHRSLKSFLPFGPFLAAGSAITFFWGHGIVSLYFKLFPL